MELDLTLIAFGIWGGGGGVNLKNNFFGGWGQLGSFTGGKGFKK